MRKRTKRKLALAAALAIIALPVALLVVNLALWLVH